MDDESTSAEANDLQFCPSQERWAWWRLWFERAQAASTATSTVAATAC